MRGFSLLELIVSFGILTCAILMVAGIFSSVLRHSQKAGELSAGTMVARSVLADFCYGILAVDADREAFFGGSYAPDPINGVERLYGTDFSWLITHSPVAELEETSGPPDESSRVRQVLIEVYWSGSTDRVRQGSGLLRVELSRLLNEQMSQ